MYICKVFGYTKNWLHGDKKDELSYGIIRQEMALNFKQKSFIYMQK